MSTLNILSVYDPSVIASVWLSGADEIDINFTIIECEFSDKKWSQIDKEHNKFIAKIINDTLVVIIDQICYSLNPVGNQGRLIVNTF